LTEIAFALLSGVSHKLTSSWSTVPLFAVVSSQTHPGGIVAASKVVVTSPVVVLVVVVPPVTTSVPVALRSVPYLIVQVTEGVDPRTTDCIAETTMVTGV
jgi:hypothetical protein